MTDNGRTTLDSAFELMGEGRHAAALSLLSEDDGRCLRGQFENCEHDAWYAIGDCLTCMAKYEEAVDAFLKAYDARPGDRDTIFALGNCYTKVQDYESAVIAFGFICLLDSDDQEARFNLGSSYYDTGEYDLAIKHLNMIDQRNPSLRDKARRNIELAQAADRKAKEG